MESQCPVCPIEEETTYHSLVGCAHIEQVWQSAGFVNLLQPKMGFGDWFGSIMGTQTREQIFKIAFVLYQI